MQVSDGTSIRQNNNLPFAELLERWTNDAPALHDTVSAHPDVSQVAPDDAVIHDDSLRKAERNICEDLKHHPPSIPNNRAVLWERYKGLISFCLLPYFAIKDDVLTPTQN